MFQPVVQLRSGGYIVINQAEALVAIDVNSGRATREHHIEDTALKTNMEAAEEIARQLRLRDLAGLIVIDFIDMDEKRNNRTVERRLKEALKHDRARIQVGRISHFGLLEMSRQRIRTSVLESSTEKCPICGGSGHVRSVSSVTLALLRSIEETLLKGATHNLIVRTRAEVALYVLNQKRSHLRALEERFRITITVSADPSVVGAQAFVIDRGEQVHSTEAAREIAASQSTALPPVEEEIADELVGADEAEGEGEPERETTVRREGEYEGGQRRRRRRRGGRGRGNGREAGEPAAAGDASQQQSVEAGAETAEVAEDAFDQPPSSDQAVADSEDRDGGRRRRRRGRRGGRRHRRNGDNGHQERRERTEFRPEHGEPGYSSAAEPPPHPVDHAEEESSPPSTSTFGPPPEAREPVPEAFVHATEGDAPRRGSTVREPVSSGSPGEPVVSTPVISSSSGEDQAPPKRGWWGRRTIGDKN
jgi:ribonuclease E